MSSPEWMERVACSPQDDDLFYPDTSLPEKDRDVLQARALRICADCPVIVECGEYATANGERHGVWGGRIITRNTPRDSAPTDRVSAASAATSRATRIMASHGRLDTETDLSPEFQERLNAEIARLNARAAHLYAMAVAS